MVEFDVDEAPATCQRFTIRAIPTMLLGASVAAQGKRFDKSLAEQTLKEARQ
nr:thioredoxin [Mycobacterium senriense]